MKINSLKETILDYCGILSEDNPGAYVKGLYDACFKDGITVSKTGKDFNNKRLSVPDKVLNEKTAEEFANKVVNLFKQRHPEFFNKNQSQSFEGIIRDLASDYYTCRKTQ